MDYSNITELDKSNKGLSLLPDLSQYTNLKKLNYSYNKFVMLDNLPSGLKELNLSNKRLPKLPDLSIYK